MAATVKTTGPEFTKLGENVYAAIEGDEIVIRMKLDHRNDLGVDPKTGDPRKTIRVASTLGNKEMDGTDGVYIGLNAYTYRFKK